MLETFQIYVNEDSEINFILVKVFTLHTFIFSKSTVKSVEKRYEICSNLIIIPKR